MANYNLGRILPNYKGDWSSSYNYFVMDVVYYQGSSYVAKSNIPAGGANPSTNSNWQIIAMKGELSGTLTPAQEQAIIDAIMAQGVVIDPEYNHTDNNFTDADRAAVENINYGTLTIKKNGTDVGTFTANTNSTVNISVPTMSYDLSDSSELVRTAEYEQSSGTDQTIDLKANRTYDCGTLDTLTIRFEAIDPTDKATWVYPASYIYFTAGVGFALTVPTGTYFTSTPTFVDGADYRLTVKGAVIDVDRLFI